MLSEKAEVYKNEGNDEYARKDFNNAIHFYTKGIQVNCRDDGLNAKLYSNRATAHFYLGEIFFNESSSIKLFVHESKYSGHVMRLSDNLIID